MADYTAQPDSPQRQRTVYVDFADLEAKMTAQQSRAASAPKRSARKRRILRRVDDAVEPVRANVKDAARAVAQWVALITDQSEQTDLNDVLDRCLKPGPDIERVNYEALAREISTSLNIELSAKRVRNAVKHLRDARCGKVNPMTTPPPPTSVREKLEELQRTIDAEREALVNADAHNELVSRAVGTEILGVVRAAAGRVIDSDFGESIPHAIDIDELEDRYLDFVREMRTGLQAQEANLQGPAKSLHTFLVALNDYDGDAASDVRLVVSGARVVTALLGPGSLPGLIAQLNVLVAGRDLIETPDYVEQMQRLADATVELHDDAATKTYLNWARKLPEDRRVPSPVRVASYCRNNAATRLLEGLFTDDLSQKDHDWLAEARELISAMQASDPGFALLPVTTAIERTVTDLHTPEAHAAQDFFEALPEERVLHALESLLKFESNPQLVEQVSKVALATHPALRGQLLRD